MRNAHTIGLYAAGLAATLAMDAQAGTLTVRSDVEGIRIAAADALPAPSQPQRFEEGDFCRNIQITPKTRAGQHAQGLGWYVTSEVEEAGYTAVGIFSRGGDATSGTCLIGDGNVVLYRRGQPVAIVYEPPHPEHESGTVGGVVATLTAGRLRVSDWTPPGFEHADIELRPDAIVVSAVAALETACGKVGLPNIRGLEIPLARKALAQYGNPRYSRTRLIHAPRRSATRDLPKSKPAQAPATASARRATPIPMVRCCT